MTDTTVEGTDQDARSKGLTKAYGKATAALRAAHKAEFETLYVQAAADLGIDYTPRQTPEQKAEAEMARLVAQYPDLLSKVSGNGHAA